MARAQPIPKEYRLQRSSELPIDRSPLLMRHTFPRFPGICVADPMHVNTHRIPVPIR